LGFGLNKFLSPENNGFFHAKIVQKSNFWDFSVNRSNSASILNAKPNTGGRKPIQIALITPMVFDLKVPKVPFRAQNFLE